MCDNSPPFTKSSLNVKRQVRVSAFVGDDDGVWRTMDVTVGAVLSNTYVLAFVPVGAVSEGSLSEVSAMFWPLAKDSVTVPSRPARSPPDTVTSYTDEAVTSVTSVTVAVVPDDG